ncbi:MAG: DUF4345 domain-containing protein [Deltaproteobacteria bacterium]|nr:MAG: DUF4345 domain-containing protein [Deltaproteobacteria bacterium]
MARAPAILVALFALIYAAVGVLCLLDPVTALDPVGLAPTSDLGRVEVMAMYGGLELGMAGFLAWTLTTPERTRVGLMASTLSIGGLGLGRLVGTLMLAQTASLMPWLCVVELGGAVAGAVVLASSRH